MAGKVPSAYLTAAGRTDEYFKAIQKGTAPARFTNDFLENLGFKGKNDRQLIPLLKALNFLDESNVPTQVYRDYLDPKRGKIVLAKQILVAYEGIFELNRDAHKEKAADLQGSFKSLANVSEPVAAVMATTFTNLCALADIEGARKGLQEAPVKETVKETAKEKDQEKEDDTPPPSPIGLAYHIELHLPNTTDIEVFRAIFKALKEHLIH
jgi:hypothetical protein